jgi:transcriptional regulator with XRE-family HTH domain
MKRRADRRAERRDEIAAALGSAMREARMDRHESQVDVARRLGVDQTLLSKWELGRVMPDFEDVELIESGLQLRRGWLLLQAGLVELTHDDTEAAILSDPFITAEGKTVLIRILVSERNHAAAMNTVAVNEPSVQSNGPSQNHSSEQPGSRVGGKGKGGRPRRANGRSK